LGDERPILFITVAPIMVEARDKLSRFFHDPWNFEVVEEGPDVLRRAQELGIVPGEGKAL